MNAGGARGPEGGARDPEGGARDPEGEAAVRRLLADAGGPVPMPADVAARLDEVLADLERERSAESAEAVGGVVPLRSRRRWPRVLLAAAAVVVGGYSVGTVAVQGTLSGGGDSAPAAESAVVDQDAGGDVQRREDHRAADRPEAGERPAGPRPGEVEGKVEEDAQGSTSAYLAELARPVVRLRSDALETDVRRALRVLDRRVTATTDRRSDLMLQRAGCPAPASDGRWLSVRYDGEPAVLVAGPERQGLITVTVYDCSGTELVSTRVAR